MRTEEVRNILVYEWDPIDIGDNPNLFDEYDEYIPSLIQLMSDGCDKPAIIRFFEDIERELHLNGSVERREKAATALVQLRNHEAGEHSDDSPQ
jgi:hypothetical protein